MTDDNSPEVEPEAPEGPHGRGDSAATAESAPPEPVTPEAQIAELKEQHHRTREQLLRVAADFDNYRKRMQRELEDARRRAAQGVVKDLLPVFDNLERATSHVAEDGDVRPLAEGLRMVRRQLESTLSRMGVVRIECVGKPFDPAVHEGIQHVESTDHPAGVVVAEVQAGYTMGTDLVRPAMVVVSRGAPAAVAAPAPAASEPEPD